jgi:hypothetical protein
MVSADVYFVSDSVCQNTSSDLLWGGGFKRVNLPKGMTLFIGGSSPCGG